MKEQNIRTHQTANGLTLVVEPMTDVQSASFSLMVPAGSIYDAQDRNGTAAVLCELITRGAGDRDSKQLSLALDNLGVQHSESNGHAFLTFSGATLAENLHETLTIFGDVVRRPHLPADQFEAARSGVAQSLQSLEDEPRQKVMQELRRRCYDAPWGLPTDGSLDELQNIDAEAVRGHYERCVRPNDAILGVAGKVDFDQVREVAETIFGDWQSKPDPETIAGPRGPSRDHIEHDSSQTHIGIAYESVPYSDPDYYAAWAAVGVLSGGMSSRLFTEVREKRGLCYSIYAGLSSLRDQARVLCYAGSVNERAQETLDVTLQELTKLGEGILPTELDRCKARAKSSLIMQQESTFARSSAIARDWYHLGRVTTLAEVRDKIEALTVEKVLDFVNSHPANDFTILTIGPEGLSVGE